MSKVNVFVLRESTGMENTVRQSVVQEASIGTGKPVFAK